MIGVGVLELAHAHRGRFRPAEHRTAGENQNRRHDDRADDVDVAHRIERDSAQIGARRVAGSKRRERVRRLVDRDREQQDQKLDRAGKDTVLPRFQHQTSAGCRSRTVRLAVLISSSFSVSTTNSR